MIHRSRLKAEGWSRLYMVSCQISAVMVGSIICSLPQSPPNHDPPSSSLLLSNERMEERRPSRRASRRDGDDTSRRVSCSPPSRRLSQEAATKTSSDLPPSHHLLPQERRPLSAPCHSILQQQKAGGRRSSTSADKQRQRKGPSLPNKKRSMYEPPRPQRDDGNTRLRIYRSLSHIINTLGKHDNKSRRRSSLPCITNTTTGGGDNIAHVLYKQSHALALRKIDAAVDKMKDCKGAPISLTHHMPLHEVHRWRSSLQTHKTLIDQAKSQVDCHLSTTALRHLELRDRLRDLQSINIAKKCPHER